MALSLPPEQFELLVNKVGTLVNAWGAGHLPDAALGFAILDAFQEVAPGSVVLREED
jgi:hypothetical protein